MATILCGFPGIGKSYLAKQSKALDTDFSTFAKGSDWPQNYVETLLERAQANEYDLVLASTHKEVREGLVRAGSRFILVYPDVSLKEEYLQRFLKRGSPKPFIQLMEARWEEFLQECRSQRYAWHWVLGPGQYLADCYPRILQQG
jgi:adenylate kinase family enzyme